MDLGLDELEAVRLTDMLGLTQAEAATSMGVSQPTLNRILAGARRKIAECLVEGHALRIGSAGERDDATAEQLESPSRGRCPGRRGRGWTRSARI